MKSQTRLETPLAPALTRVFITGITLAIAMASVLTAACSGTPATTQEAHLEAVAAEHAGDRPVPAAAAAAFAPGEIFEQTVDYGVVSGISATGFVAWPAAVDGPVPGVLVIHEWWGLNDNVREMARRLAAEGYVALAVDLYGGRSAGDSATARALVSEAMQDVAAMRRNLSAAHAFLRQRAGATAIGSIGWCFGGARSLDLALELGDALDAAVMYYGRPVLEPARLRELRAPLLGLFAGNDSSIPSDSVREFEATLARLGKDASIHIYPDTGHAFANPSGTRYDESAAVDAWTKTLAFFDAHLRRDAPDDG